MDVTAELPARAIEPIRVAVQDLEPGHGLGRVTLPLPGAPTFRFTVRMSEVDEDTVSATPSMVA